MRRAAQRIAIAALVLAATLPRPATAGEVVVAARTLRIGTIVAAEDLRLDGGGGPAERAAILSQYLGLEARRAIYAGRPVTPHDLGPPTLVTRNALVTMTYETGALAIRTEGRALDAGGAGERIRVMNLDSRLSVRATVTGPNLVEVRK